MSEFGGECQEVDGHKASQSPLKRCGYNMNVIALRRDKVEREIVRYRRVWEREKEREEEREKKEI